MSIAFVHGIEFTTSGSSTASQSLGYSVAVGDLIAVGMRFSLSDATPPAVTDSLGNTYTAAEDVVSGSGHAWLYVSVASNAGTPTVSIDATASGAAAVRWAGAVYTGAFGSGTPTGTQTATGSGSPATTAAVSSATASSLLLGLMGTVSDIAATGPTSPWAIVANGGGRCVLAYRILSASSSNDVTFTWTGTDNGWGALLASFDEAASGPSAAALARYRRLCTNVAI